MTPTDILPVQTKPAKSAGSSRKGEDAAADAGETGFARAMKQVANGKKQSTAAARQPGHVQEMAAARARLLEGEKSQRSERALVADEIASEADEDDNGRLAREDGETQVPAQGVTASRETHDVLALMMAHSRGHEVPRHDAVPTARSIDGEQTPAISNVASASVLEKLNVVSIKLETHLAQANAQPASMEIAHKLAQLGTDRAGGTTKADRAAVATKVVVPGEHGPSVKVSAPEASEETLLANGQMVAEFNAGQRGSENLAGGDRGGKDDAKLAPARLDNAEAIKPVADKAALPVSTGSPMEQIAPRLIDTAREMKAADRAAATASTSSPATPSAGPMRVLSIDLHPAELGSVTVRMSLAGDTLGVQIEAERSETVRMLQNDASALSDMLRTAGVQVEGVTVRAAQMDTVSSGAGTSQSFMHENSQSQSGGAQADARGSGGNGREQGRQPFGEGPQDQGQNGQQRSHSVAGSGLYV